MIGRVLQTLVAAQFADQCVTAQSHRVNFDLPGSYSFFDIPGTRGRSDGSSAQRKEIPTLVEKIAKSLLPARMRERLAAREAQRMSHAGIGGGDREGLADAA